MRALMISKYFPPNLGAEELVSGKFAHALEQVGVDVHVIAGLRPGPRDQSPTWDGRLPPTTRLRCGDGGVWNRLRNIAARLRFRYFGDLDGWAIQAMEAGDRLLRDHQFDCIVSRTLPEQTMVVAASLAEEHGLPWIACINDPIQGYFPPPYDFGRRGAQARLKRAWLSRTLPRADCMVFPCERLADYYLTVLGLERSDRVSVIPHIGWRAESAGRTEEHERLELYHIGNLSKSRSATPFFEALAAICSSQDECGPMPSLHLVGRVAPEIENTIHTLGLEHVVTIHAPVSYYESLCLMQRADALVLLEADMSEGIFLPSKLCDYIVSERPILMYSPDVGSVADIVGGTGHPGFMGQTVHGAERALIDLTDRMLAGDSADEFLLDPLPFRSDTVANQVVNEIRALLS